MKDFAKNELHTPQHAQETTLTSFAPNQDNKKELNFLTRPDVAFGFVNKRSGYEINFDQFPGGCAWIYNSVSKTVLISYPDLLSTASVLQWYGHPRVLGFSIPKTLVIWASPSHITLAIWVRVTGDANITRCLGMGMPKTRGRPYHCDIGFVNKRSGDEIKTVLQRN